MRHKVSKKKSRDFFKGVCTYLESIGAANTETFEDIEQRTYQLWVTTAGPVRFIVKPETDSELMTVYARFEYPECAKRFSCLSPRLNSYSGKWNFHFDNVWPAEDALRAFTYEVNRIFPEDLRSLLQDSLIGKSASHT